MDGRTFSEIGRLKGEEIFQGGDGWPAGLRGYLTALDDNVDWPRIAEELEAVVPESLKNSPAFPTKPDYMVGLEWARRVFQRS